MISNQISMESHTLGKERGGYAELAALEVFGFTEFIEMHTGLMDRTVKDTLMVALA